MNNKYGKIYASHLGTILSNYSILGSIFMLLVVLGSFLSGLYFLLAFVFAFVLVAITFGLIFVSNPEIITNLFKTGDNLTQILNICAKAFPYVFGITLGASIISLILLCLNKEKRSTKRIVFSSIILGLVLILGLIFFLGGVK